jgi:hypothetical protein
VNARIDLLATGEGEYRLHDPDTPRPRARAGLPARTGAGRVVILRAKLGFDYTPHGLTLLDALAPPSARELEILRKRIDPGWAVFGRAAKS